MRKPMLWQSRALDYLTQSQVRNGGSLLFVPMRYGKTKPVVDYLIAGKKRRALIVCPLSVIPVWQIEAKTDWGEDVKFTVRQRYTGKEEQGITVNGSLSLHLINYQLLRRWRCSGRPASWWADRFDAVVLDEVHNIKNPSAQITQLCHRLFKLVPCRIGLTGTPSSGGTLDLWGPFYFAFGAAGPLGDNYWRARNTLYSPDAMGWEWRPKEGTLEKLDQFVQAWTFLLRDEERISLPERNYVRFDVPLCPAQRQAYATMAELFFAEVEGRMFEEKYILAQMLRLLQITSGFLYNKTKALRLPSPKRDLAVQMVCDGAWGKPVVVWVYFVADADLLVEELQKKGMAVATLLGRDNLEQRERALKMFNAGALNCLIAQLAVGGVGLDLSAARTQIFFGANFSSLDRTQAEERLRKVGQGTVTTIDLVVPNSIDSYARSVVQGKVQFNERIVNLAQLRGYVYGQESAST